MADVMPFPKRAEARDDAPRDDARLPGRGVLPAVEDAPRGDDATTRFRLGRELRRSGEAWRDFAAFARVWRATARAGGDANLIDLACSWLACAHGRRVEEHALLATLTPAHVHAARRAADAPRAVGRLLVESGRHLGLTEPTRSFAVLSEAIELLRSAGAREALHDEPCRDLIALARAGFAEAHHRQGESARAATSFATVDVEAVADPEIRAAVSTIRAELLRRQGEGARARILYDQVLDLIDEARDDLLRTGATVDARFLDQRMAETRLRQGALLLELGSFAGAAETLRRAVDLLPIGPATRLRHDLFHLLAVAEIKTGAYDDARQHLVAARAIAKRVPVPERLGVERRWLEGLLAGEKSDFEEAARALVEATGRFLDLGRQVDAARVLLDLLDVCAVRQDRDLDDEVRGLRDSIAESEAMTRYLGERLDRFEQRLRASGLLVPPLRSLIADMRGRE